MNRPLTEERKKFEAMAKFYGERARRAIEDLEDFYLQEVRRLEEKLDQDKTRGDDAALSPSR